jgi:asparagine synthase (glutamine-hydrolysing)
MLEFPHKTTQNILWIAETMHSARKDGSRILLTGEYGNLSISLDTASHYFVELLNKKKFITFLREYCLFARASDISLARKIKNALRDVYKHFAKKTVAGFNYERIIGNSFVFADFLQKNGFSTRLAEYADDMAAALTDYSKMKNFLVSDITLSQLGIHSTKLSLLTGVITRDPAKDKRLVELMVRLPVSQFTRDGIIRRIVREYMKNDMPSHVMDVTRKGIQSADKVARLIPHWGRIYKEMAEIFENNTNSAYVDCRKALHELEKIKDTPQHMKVHKMFNLLILQYTAIALEFIRRYE